MDLATVATSWKKLTLWETWHCLLATMVSNSIPMTCWQVVRQESVWPTGPFLENDRILNMPQWERRLDHVADCCRIPSDACLRTACRSPPVCPKMLPIDHLRTIKHWPPKLYLFEIILVWPSSHQDGGFIPQSLVESHMQHWHQHSNDCCEQGHDHRGRLFAILTGWWRNDHQGQEKEGPGSRRWIKKRDEESKSSPENNVYILKSHWNSEKVHGLSFLGVTIYSN